MNKFFSMHLAANQHKVRFLVVVLLLVSTLTTSLAASYPTGKPAVSAPRTIATNVEQTRLSFIPNIGQTDPSVTFQTHNLGGTLFFRAHEVVLSLPDLSAGSGESELSSHVVDLRFENANPETQITGGEILPGTVNYLKGSNPANWYTDLTTYGDIVYEQLYPGIDLHYTGTEGVLKGTYIVATGADPNQIHWRYNGVQDLHVDSTTGDLVITVDTPAKTELIERAPVAWQMINEQQIPVEIQYALNDDHSIRFALGYYDPAHPLILDPDLQYSTYIGGIGTDQGTGIAADANGNTYIVGLTASTTFPTTGALQGTLKGTADAFVTKLNSSGTAIFSTYFGGDSYDNGTSIAIDTTGIYLVGETESTNFPTSTGAYQISNGGSADVFVTKLSLSGNSILYSTYLGGLDYDSASSVAVNNGYAYITGKTTSTDFDKSATPFQGNLGGGTDAFVTRVNTNGQSLIFSTFLGGDNTDIGETIAIGPSGVVYVAGRTQSLNFPVFSAAYSTNAGLQDAFVTKFSSTGTRLFSTYLGSALDDAAYGLAVDTSGNVYITGETDAVNDFPVPTGNPPLPSHGRADAFVAKLSSAGTTTTLQFSKLIGGSEDDGGAGIALDSTGNVFLTGNTQSADFPVLNYFQGHGTYKGETDAFVLKLQAGTFNLEYSSFLGGPFEDRGLRIVVDSYGATLVIGNTGSDTMFAQPLAQFGGLVDAFVVRIGSLSADLDIDNLDSPDPVEVGQTLTYTITVINRGPDSAGNVVMTDTLPVEVSFVSVDNEACTHVEGTITCNLSSMAANTEVDIIVETQVMVGGLIRNIPTVASDQFDPNSGNNRAESYTQADAIADLTLGMTVNNFLPASQSTVTYIVTLSNKGPSPASTIQVDALLPTGLTLKGTGNPSIGSYNPALGLWQISLLNPDESATLTLEATVNAAKGTKLTYEVTAEANQTDPNPTDNSAALEITVTSGLPLPGCHPSKSNPAVVICLSR